MTFKPAIWYPISAVLTAVNVGAVWFAAQAAEPAHATVHAALAVAFGLWAYRLRRPSGDSQVEAGLEALEGEVGKLRQELGEAHERLDFAERVLAQGQEVRRVDPER